MNRQQRNRERFRRELNAIIDRGDSIMVCITVAPTDVENQVAIGITANTDNETVIAAALADGLRQLHGDATLGAMSDGDLAKA